MKLTFEQYDAQNPSVWRMFKRFTLDAILSGHRRFSADSILHRIRWETTVSARNARYKINNNFSADYARKFMREYPQFGNFFEIRKRHISMKAKDGFPSIPDHR